MSDLKSYAHLRLADHVRACRIGHQIVFLDLRRGRYVGVEGYQASALFEILLGRQALTVIQAIDPGTAALHELIDRLRIQHLLSDSPRDEAPSIPSMLGEPSASVDFEDERRIAGSEWRHLGRLWRSTLVASAWLRRYSLDNIAQCVQNLRERHATPEPRLDVGALRLAAARYARLRPFASTTHDRCLHDSLALVHFLAVQGLFPHWVIGVRTSPFCAHSWVQFGDLVLNDMPERVRQFRPILVV